MNEQSILRKQQLEIRLPAPCRPRQGAFRQRRVSRARWWFSQMRRVVDESIEWNTGTAARPEQTHLPLTRSC